MRRSPFFPDEAYPPLVIDADRVLPLPISSQRFKPIARGHTQIAEYAGLIQKTKLPQRDVLHVWRQFRLRRPDRINSAWGSAKL